MKVKLTPRLEKIAELVSKNSRVADIGTDHGYISIYLLEKGVSSHIIASDVNKGPLETARKNIEEHGYKQEVDLRLGSGLEVLRPKEIDTAIIAGMGGILIGELLQANPEVTNSIDTFILQPMQAQEELRRYLVTNGFKIQKDLLIKEDFRIYEILVAKKGTQEVKDNIFYEIGFFLKDNPTDLATEFIEGKIKVQQEIINHVKKQQSLSATQKHQQSKDKLKKLEEVLQWLKK
ncbi:tRNA (adenine(22)-N(1))-methyltransferase [Natronincola ferrireducens]|uniref:tRNA (Adenine22-N1)-methyltransferase n=1 Tax=Natronincola ferrireducens TaxID=393762 RepID=A0A1G9BIY3_9FIRM|nr:class I SAM-dependent methyltransferase [Natronincola ferrireducens]SDK39431.1 tRNA (adenine22-N1)-methyltransferase [Natronincola ferrireducens]